MNEDLHAKNGRILLPEWSFPGIYLITNMVNGKIYVGQAQDIRVRMIEHRRRRNGGPTHLKYSPLYKSVRKHGGWHQFEFSVLEQVERIGDLDAREAFWIEKKKSFDSNIGYNLCRNPKTTRGWRSPLIGSTVSQESIDKYRQSRLRNKKPIIMSEEWREKNRIGAARRRKLIAQIDPITEKVMFVWFALKFVSEQFGCSYWTAISAIKRKNKSHGFRWDYYTKEAA